MSSDNALIQMSRDQPRLFGLNKRYYKDDLILGSVMVARKSAVIIRIGIAKSN